MVIRKEIAQKDDCIVCLHPITHPICTECHLKEITAWMKNLDFPSLTIQVIKKEVLKKLTNMDAYQNSKCILCNKNHLTMCAYCFFLASAKVLEELNFTPKMLREFLETFNYRAEYTEYGLNLE